MTKLRTFLLCLLMIISGCDCNDETGGNSIGSSEETIKLDSIGIDTEDSSEINNVAIEDTSNDGSIKINNVGSDVINGVDSEEISLFYYPVTFYNNLSATNEAKYNDILGTCNFILERLELPHRLKLKAVHRIPNGMATDAKRVRYVKGKKDSTIALDKDNLINIVIIQGETDGPIAITDYDKTGVISIKLKYELDPVVIVHELFHRLTLSLNHTNNAQYTLAGIKIPSKKNCLNLLSDTKFSAFGFNLTKHQQDQFQSLSTTPSGYSEAMVYPDDSVMIAVRKGFTCCNVDRIVNDGYIDALAMRRRMPLVVKKYPVDTIKKNLLLLNENYNICISDINESNLDSIKFVVAKSKLNIQEFPEYDLSISFDQNFLDSIEISLVDLVEIYNIFENLRLSNNEDFRKEAAYLHTEEGLNNNEIYEIRTSSYKHYRESILNALPRPEFIH